MVISGILEFMGVWDINKLNQNYTIAHLFYWSNRFTRIFYYRFN